MTRVYNMIDFIANDIAGIYGGEGYYQFKKLCIDNTMNPCFIVSEFYPSLWSILSEEFIADLFSEWKEGK